MSDLTKNPEVIIPMKMENGRIVPNLRLIAAAPALLEALKKIERLLDDEGGDDYGDSLTTEEGVVLDIARAAIAAAEGKE